MCQLNLLAGRYLSLFVRLITFLLTHSPPVVTISGRDISFFSRASNPCLIWNQASKSFEGYICKIAYSYEHDRPGIHFLFQSQQMTLHRHLQFKAYAWMIILLSKFSQHSTNIWVIVWWLSDMPTLTLPTSGQFWDKHFQVNPSSEMPTLVTLEVLTFLFMFLLLFDVNLLESEC